MSNLFEDRERGYEAKWAHEEEMHFKIMSLRNGRLARWAAVLMQLSPKQADQYAQTVAAAGIGDGKADAVFARISEDLKTKGVSCPDATIRQKMKDLYLQAERELTG